ncbi:ybaK/ebsC protein [Saccharomonospora cyanea NA-134]|uniref:Cys-tRNA(Pro)/Cys-tRNA(Cys) deacylase n=1 Tax=Saccharomonospora cyanea NA-134 TaxID=882082 RepID=H5XJA8_9PSEU|nr:ybaK/ebsC protein [Saccharomonospora cyanea NA-134]
MVWSALSARSVQRPSGAGYSRLPSGGVAGKGTPATALLTKRKVPHTLHTYDHDPRESSYGVEAAAALGVAEERVFKTLVAEVDGKLTVGVVPVTGQLNLKALAAAVGGKKAKMADTGAAQRATGYVLGGISPLGQRTRLPVVVDVSARRFDTVFCSGGRRGLEIELAPDDLVGLTAATVAPIAG